VSSVCTCIWSVESSHRKGH